MASIRKEILTSASADEVWDAIRDIGALHTRLVPGFVVDTKLEFGERIVTFGNGLIVREPIVDIDDKAQRLVGILRGCRHANDRKQRGAKRRGEAMHPSSFI